MLCPDSYPHEPPRSRPRCKSKRDFISDSVRPAVRTPTQQGGGGGPEHGASGGFEGKIVSTGSDVLALQDRYSELVS